MAQASIKKNFIMNVILTMSSFIFPFITFPYISRVLQPGGYGKVQFATSVISYFSMFAQLGIPTYGIRVCAQVRDDREQLTRTVHELLFINLITNLISYAVLLVAVLSVPKFREEKTLLLIISATIFLSSIGMEWLYKALEQYTYITVRSVIFKFIALIAMLLLVHEKSDYLIYGGITIFASSASNILNLLNAHKYVDFKPVCNYEWKRHLKPVATFFAMACASTIYTNLDNVMLGFMTTDVDVGYYSAAVKIKTILVSVVTSLGAVVLPRASFYVEHGEVQAFQRICRKALNFVVLIALPLTVYFISFAKHGILFLSGNAYEGSILPMQVIMPTLLLIGVTNIMGIQILVPTGREVIVLYSEVAGAVTDVIINAALIPRMASTGAAIGTLVAESVVLAVQYYYLRNEISEMVKGIHWGRILFATLMALVLASWVKRLEVGHFITLALSSMLFFGIYGLFLLLKKEELVVEIWKQVLSRIKR